MTRAPHDLRLLRLKRAPCRVIQRFPSQALLDEAAVLTAMAYVDLNPIRAGIAETPETSDFTSVQQRIAAWKGRQTMTNDEIRPEKNENASLDATIIKLLGFSEDSQDNTENTLPYSTTDYLELVDWLGRVIVEGKKGFIPEQLPPIQQRLNMRPEQYLAYVRKPKYGFANALGALDKLKACADHFEKAFLSPPFSPLCRSEGATGPVARAFCDRAHRKRTRLYVEDARPSETPWTLGMAAPQ